MRILHQVWNWPRVSISPGPDLPTRVANHAILSINESHSILIGGDQGLNLCSNKTWIFDHHENTNWTHGPILRIGRSHHTAGILRDKKTSEEFIAVIGGVNSSYDPLDSVEIFKTNNGITKWSQSKYFMQWIFFTWWCLLI